MKPHLQTLTYITLILGFLVISPGTATAQRQISIDSIASHMGEQVTVCSRVYGTHVTKGEKPVNSKTDLSYLPKRRSKLYLCTV